MALTFACLFFALLGAITFLPGMRLLYAKNPAFMGMVLTLSACFLGVFGALEFSKSEEREDRMARAATLMDMTKESLSASRLEARILSQLKPENPEAGPGAETVSPATVSPDARAASGSSKELSGLLNNDAVLAQISPQSLKALLACQVALEREMQRMAATGGRDRRHHLNTYLRELAFAQGVLAAESEFQRGNIGRGDLTEILQDWTLKKDLPRI